MKDIDWAGLIAEVLARTAHIESAVAAARGLHGIDRQVLERWRKNVEEGKPHGVPLRGGNARALLEWARATLTAKELARYRVPPVKPPTNGSPQRNDRPDPPRRVRRR